MNIIFRDILEGLKLTALTLLLAGASAVLVVTIYRAIEDVPVAKP